jgi:hypothetical protein
MTLRFVATLALLVTAGLSSACTSAADPPTPTPAPTDANKPVEAAKFPDMSGYTPVKACSSGHGATRIVRMAQRRTRFSRRFTPSPWTG